MWKSLVAGLALVVMWLSPLWLVEHWRSTNWFRRKHLTSQEVNTLAKGAIWNHETMFPKSVKCFSVLMNRSVLGTILHNWTHHSYPNTQWPELDGNSNKHPISIIQGGLAVCHLRGDERWLITKMLIPHTYTQARPVNINSELKAAAAGNLITLISER